MSEQTAQPGLVGLSLAGDWVTTLTVPNVLRLQRLAGNGVTAAVVARQVPPAPAPDPEEKARFLGQTFGKKNHTPDLGGMFDLDYAPARRELKVTMTVAFAFENVAPESVRPELRPFCTWKADEKERWQSEFCRLIAARWSGKATIRCTKPGWEDVMASPSVRVVQTAGGEAHFHATVVKEVAGPVQAGVSGRSVTFSESNVQPEQDANPHENEMKRKQLMTQEKGRLEQALGASGASPVIFPTQGLVVPAASRERLWAFGRALAARMPSAPRLQVTVVGESKGEPAAQTAAYAQRRADLVATTINGTAGGHPVGASGKADGGDACRASIGIADDDPYFQQEYAVAPHEFGHMLGNPDEYHDEATEADPTKKAVVEAKKKKWQALLRSAKVQVPMEGEEASTTSQMSKGVDVLPAHYITVWQLLGELTAPTVKPEEWSLG